MRPVFVESAVRLNVGFRSSLMTHSDWTPDFYSPSRLQSYFGVAQFSGGLTSWMDYSGELAAGWQAEKGQPLDASLPDERRNLVASKQPLETLR
jgi:hypothetical protein